MIQLYFRKNQKQATIRPDLKDPEFELPNSLFWVDVVAPSQEEIDWLEKRLEIKFPTLQEAQEIEFSSRYNERDEIISIHTYFLLGSYASIINETISFLLRGDILVSIRHRELGFFDDIVSRILSTHRQHEDGFYVLTTIFEIRTDFAADILELCGKNISRMTRSILSRDRDVLNGAFDSVASMQESVMIVRENIADKQRVLFSLLKSDLFPEDLAERVRTILRDINSLIQYTEFLFERMDYLQSTLQGILNAEQSQVIKIFTVMSVVFLPPTLIASIYGMNFAYMPELHWQGSYPVVIVLMVLSSILPIWIFKKRGWL